MSQFLNTYIHITGITDTSFTLGDPTPDSNGIDVLKDGSTYSYITNNGATFEVGTGKFTSATRSLSRDITESSSVDNQPISWPTGTVLRLTIPPISGQTGSSGGSGSGSNITVIDDLGNSRTDAISQRAASDAIKQRVASIDSNLGIASMQLDGEGNIIVTDNQGGQHNVSLSAVSGDGAKDGDALAKTLNLYIGKDGSILLLDSSGKLWSIPDVSSMTKAIADAGSGSTNTTYATTDLANVTDATFQARKLSTDQVISALGFTPLGSDTDLAAYAKKDFSNVDKSTIQAMEFVSKQITDALGYVPAKQIDANGLALTDLSNVSTDTFNKKLSYPVSGEDPTVASGGANSDNKGIRHLYAKTVDNGDTTAGAVLPKGQVEYVVFALTNSSYGAESAHKIQILTREQVEYLVKNGGGGSSNITLVDNLNGNSTTAAPTQNAVAQNCIIGNRAGKNTAFPGTTMVTDNIGWGFIGNNQSGTAPCLLFRKEGVTDNSSDGWYRVPVTKNISGDIDIGITVSNSYGNSKTLPSSQNMVSSYFVSSGTEPNSYNNRISRIYAVSTGTGMTTLPTDSIFVDFVGTQYNSRTMELASKLFVAANYAPLAIDNLTGTSTTAPPSQNSVKVAVADLQAKIDALTARVAALESK